MRQSVSRESEAGKLIISQLEEAAREYREARDSLIKSEERVNACRASVEGVLAVLKTEVLDD